MGLTIGGNGGTLIDSFSPPNPSLQLIVRLHDSLELVAALVRSRHFVLCRAIVGEYPERGKRHLGMHLGVQEI